MVPCFCVLDLGLLFGVVFSSASSAKRLLVAIGELYGAQESPPLLTGRWCFPAVTAADTADTAVVGVAMACVSVFAVLLLDMLHVNDCPCLADSGCSEHGIRS